MNERKLRLEVLQGDDGGDYGISRVPRWQPTGRDAMITNDITGSVMKIRVTDSSGKLLSIIIGKNGTIQEVKNEQSESLNQHDGTRMNLDENVIENRLSSEVTMDESCNVDLSLVKEEMEIEEPGPSEPYTDLLGVVSEGYNDGANLNASLEEEKPKLIEMEVEDKKEPEMLLEKIKTEDTEMAGQFETVFVDPSMVENDETETETETQQNTELPNIIFETNDHGIGMPYFCRLCASRDDDMIDIFGMDEVYRNIIDDYLPVTIKTSDYLPKKACRPCIAKVKQFHSFYETVADSQKQFSMLEDKILSEIKGLKNYPKVIPQCNGQLAPNENSELEFIIKPITSSRSYGPVTRRRKKTENMPDEVKEEKKTDCLDRETDIIKCRICGRFFGTPKSCYSHSRIHACNGYVPCSMCDKIFTNRKDAHIHSWDHILPLTTQKVREMMKKKLDNLKLDAIMNVKGMINAIEENRKAEEEAIKNTGIRCRICSAVFLNTIACYKHSIEHAKGNYHPCCMCNKDLSSKAEALVHSLEHVTYLSSSRTKSKPVKKSNKQTIVKIILPDSELGKYLMDKDGKPMKRITPEDDDDCDMVKCRLCGRFFGTGKSCYAHAVIHNSENYYPCSMCEASFTNQKDSFNHSIKHTMSKLQKKAEMMRKHGYDPVTPATQIIFDKIMEKNGGIEIIHDKQSLLSSEQERDDDMVKCRLCGHYFGTGKSCYAHSAVHFTDNYYPCSMCDKTFTTRKESYEHSYIHTVTKPVQRMSDMIRTRGTIEPKPVQVPMKIDKDANVMDINKGKVSTEGEVVKCRFCGAFFKSILDCYKHAKTHYSRKKYPCCMCDKEFTTLGESYVHSLSHETTGLPVRNSTADEMPDEDEVSDDWIQCSVCKIYLKSAVSFHSHCYSHITTDNFPCCICDKSFETDAEYCLHSRKHCSDGSGAKEGKVVIPICNKCGKRFPTDDRLKFHKVYHDPRTKPCYCRRCDKNFASESSLYEHIQAVHTEAAQELEYKRTREELKVRHATHKKIVFECTACKSRFNSHEKLKSHKLSSCSSDEIIEPKYYTCSYCGKTFFRKNSLRFHEQIHANEESKKEKEKNETVETSLKCTKCEKTFPNIGGLRNHAALHAAQKPFNCYKCHKSFRSEEAREEHTKISHKDTSIDCDICGQNFLRPSHLEKHKTVWHKQIK